jgi:hypothetical protein
MLYKKSSFKEPEKHTLKTKTELIKKKSVFVNKTLFVKTNSLKKLKTKKNRKFKWLGTN